MMSAVRKTSARLGRIFAPLPAYSASVYPASTPAPLSTTASRPSFAKVGSTAGTNETRRSPGKLSRGTPTIMQQPPTSYKRHRIYTMLLLLSVCFTGGGADAILLAMPDPVISAPETAPAAPLEHSRQQLEA